MNYTIEELGFILYNNRSVNGVIKNFFDSTIDPLKLIQIEKKFDWCKLIYEDLEKMVEVDTSLLNINAEDENLKPDDLFEITDLIKSNIGKFSIAEKDFLTKRKITDSLITKYNLLGLSSITNPEYLRRIGATCHPILDGFLKDGIQEGGIVFPLFNQNGLTNCAIRRISDVGKLKYTLAVPDTPVWGLDGIEDKDICLCEGIFDMIALKENGFNACSPSAAMWSGIQLYQLLEKNPKSIIIFCDNDRIGLKTGIVLSKFFNLLMIPNKTIHSKVCKDASEHFFDKGLGLEEIEEIKIIRKMVEDKNDNSFDFLKHLQKRKF